MCAGCGALTGFFSRLTGGGCCGAVGTIIGAEEGYTVWPGKYAGPGAAVANRETREETKKNLSHYYFI